MAVRIIMTKALIVVLLVTCGAVAKRTRRGLTSRPMHAGNFMIIRNETFPCHSIQYSNFPRAELDNAALRDLLSELGGHYIKGYMAEDEAEARRTFIDLLSIHPKYQQKNQKFHKVADNLGSKQKVMDHLDDFFSHLTVGGVGVENKTKAKNASMAPLRPNTKPQSRNLRSQNVSAGGSPGTRRIDYCVTRGTEEQSYLQMCTTCAATTTLPADYYPRILNEAVCSDTDAGCFIVQGIAHGMCAQRALFLTILKRMTGTCSMALLDGSNVVVDMWEPYYHGLGVACECMIHRDSMFAEFI